MWLSEKDPRGIHSFRLGTMWAFEDISHPWQSEPWTRSHSKPREMNRDRKMNCSNKKKLRKGPIPQPCRRRGVGGGGAEGRGVFHLEDDHRV